MALIDIAEDYTELTFKDCASQDIVDTFFNGNEHADTHLIDGTECLIILESSTLGQHSAHWESGAKQSFDSGLYDANDTMYIKVDDYGAKPKSGKLLTMDGGTSYQRKFTILSCDDEGGVYRMKLKRVRL